LSSAEVGEFSLPLDPILSIIIARPAGTEETKKASFNEKKQIKSIN
jgi:hypothetical protein